MEKHLHKLLVLLLLAIPQLLSGQDSLRLVFIGDVMQHMPQINGAMYNGKYDYTDCFKYVADKLSKADIAVANLELTLGDKPYAGYPCFSAPDEVALTLKDIGVDVMATANNHSCDRGKKGIVRTLDVLDSLKITNIGTYRNVSEKHSSYPLVVEKNGFRLAFICYTYGTNGIPVPSPAQVNLIDKSSIELDINMAKQHNPDAIIAIMHWGNEYQRIASKEQEQLADFMLQQGVTLVIGSHPHVVQPMKLYRSHCSLPTQAVVYSLGNFVSNQEAKHTEGGAIAYFTLVRDAHKLAIANASYSLTWVYKPIKDGVKRFYILPVEEFEGKPSFFQNGFYEKFMQHVAETRKLLNDHNRDFFEHIF